jgi:hypothetical protein
MNNGSLLLGLVGALAVTVPSRAEDLPPGPTCPPPACSPTRTCARDEGGLGDCRWTWACFPRCGCRDDYCPNPYPRQCWPPYPPFYQCVPAGACTHPPCVGVGNEGLTWWFLPTPRALREALWCRP